MDSLLTTAASGMRSRLEALDLAANNIANSGTPGFKLDRESYNLYVAPEALDPESPQPSTLPVVERNWTDFSQGSLEATGNPLDLAISGQGFFAVNGPGSTLYTRNGSFRLSSAGVLTTADGYAVREAGGGTIQLQPNVPFEITPNGTVKQGGADVGQVAVVDFGRAQALAKFGGNYFQAVDGAAAPQPVAGAQVAQGKVEASNVAAPESAVRLIGLMRQFEMLQKAINMDGQMSRQAIEQVAKVS
ncbi:MAG TPA: flagellar basal-body rod protein FlgF [Bryobacteraceae bacterium]|nr:flagellar basal-body rod protein FlgF [Bryobacteraceae bacterium]